MRVLERTIENAVVAYAKARGCVVHKMQTGRGGTSGMPDRLFMAPGGKLWWIEFKAPGKVASPLQEVKIADLRSLGQTVYVCDDREKGKAIIEAELGRRP